MRKKNLEGIKNSKKSLKLNYKNLIKKINCFQNLIKVLELNQNKKLNKNKHSLNKIKIRLQVSSKIN